uniref:Uncharacterized protein n=1 Tax=Triticum urartu TaxID=4572 RepID=A0A8R7TV71_TRIUA
MLGFRAIRRARRDADSSVRLQCCARQHGRVMQQARERLEHDGLHEEILFKRMRVMNQIMLNDSHKLAT